ncbi:unnamed protein product, partial [Rotaria sordida]
IWPSSNSSKIGLLGLFHDIPDAANISHPSFHYQAMFKAAVLLSHRYNITIDGEFLRWQVAETTGGIIDVLSDACRAVLNLNTVGIIGPELSRESQLVAPFGEKLGIPVISYASSDPDLSNKKIYPTFYRTVPSDDIAASSLVKLFIRFNWTSCSIIYQKD